MKTVTVKVCRIYQKPVTKEDSEGDALLICKDRDNEMNRELGLEAWKVRTIDACGTGDVVSRLLDPKDIRLVDATKIP